MNKPNSVVIFMAGGLVSEVATDIKDLDVTVLDFDIEGAAPIETYDLEGTGDGSYDGTCFINRQGASVLSHEKLTALRTAIKKAKPSNAGTVVHGTLRTQDLLPVFLRELHDASYTDWWKRAADVQKVAEAQRDYSDPWWESEEATELVAELIDAISAHAPPGYYFGAHPGEGSDFGYWELEEGGEGEAAPLQQLQEWTVTGVYNDNDQVFTHHVRAFAPNNAALLVTRLYPDAMVTAVIAGLHEDMHESQPEKQPVLDPREQLVDNSLRLYTVRYFDTGMGSDEDPLVFQCWAEDEDHAEEQCKDAYPDCEIDSVEAPPTYRIVRGYQNSDEREVIGTGLTLQEAQEHCSNPETCSNTCTTQEGIARTKSKGPWFDRFEKE